MLRVQGHSMINLKVWKTCADFWETYDQIEEFLKFAQVHCFPVQLVDDEGEAAKYLDKPFWAALLKKVYASKEIEKGSGIREYQDYIVNSCVQFYEMEKRRMQILNATVRNIIPENPDMWKEYVEQAIRELLNYYEGDFPADELESIREELKVPFLADQEYRSAVKSELNKFHIPDILQKVCQCTKEYKDAGKIVLICTSMQMITETGIERLNPCRLSKSSSFSSANADKSRADGDNLPKPAGLNRQVRNTIQKPDFHPPIEIIGVKALREKTECLSSRKKPYIWKLYEEDVLETGQRIQTVKFEAVQGKWETAVIQLFSVKKQQVVYELQMKPGEYRYGNITKDAVICFLPTVSRCQDKCISRPHLQDGELYVQDMRKQTWDSLNYGADVSCFSVSGEGEIYLRKGQLLLERYALARQNKKVANKLEMVSFEEFVEVRLMEGGFLLLTNRGMIRSNLSDWDGKKVVTLNKN